jgi:hypothetical protein
VFQTLFPSYAVSSIPVFFCILVSLCSLLSVLYSKINEEYVAQTVYLLLSSGDGLLWSFCHQEWIGISDLSAETDSALETLYWLCCGILDVQQTSDYQWYQNNFNCSMLHFHFLFPSLCGLSTFKTLYSVLNTCHFLKSSKLLHVSAWIGHPQVLIIVF